MFEEGAGFSAFQLKVLVTALIFGVTFIWGAWAVKGHFALFLNEDIKGMDLLHSILKVIFVCLSISAFIAITFV